MTISHHLACFHSSETSCAELIVNKMYYEPYTCDSYDRIDYSRADVSVSLEYPVDYIKVEDSDGKPVDRADNNQNQQ